MSWCPKAYKLEKLRVCSSVGQSAPLIRVRSEVQILPDPPVPTVECQGP